MALITASFFSADAAAFLATSSSFLRASSSSMDAVGVDGGSLPGPGASPDTDPAGDCSRRARSSFLSASIDLPFLMAA